MKVAVILLWVSVIVLVVTAIAWQMFEYDASSMRGEQSMWEEAGINQTRAMCVVRAIAKTLIITSGIAIIVGGFLLVFAKKKVS